MKRSVKRSVAYTIIVAAVIVLAAFASFEILNQSRTQTRTYNQEIEAAANWLALNYNPHLIRETPNNSTYWLYSDNFLASLALSQINSGNKTLTMIAENITSALARYSSMPNITSNQYTALTSGLCVFPSAAAYTVSTSAGNTIRTTINNGTGLLAEQDYADIAFLDAVCQHRPNGNMTEAITAYDDGMRLFDGAGFTDLAYNVSQPDPYQTYKLALFLYANAALDQPINIGTVVALSTLLKMQAIDGGFYTGYNSSHSHGSTTTNTETTSLALLALERVNGQ